MTRRELGGDALLALAMTALSAALLAGFPGLPWPVYALALVHPALLALRRRAPLPAMATALVAAGAYGALGYPTVGLGVAPLVWAYSIGWLLPRPRSLVLLAAVEAGAVASGAVGGQGDAATVAGNLVVLGVAYLLGDAARRRRELLTQLRERAAQLEAAQAEVARTAVAEERLRIARELHDVVAHGMSVIAVQAGSARLVLDRDPARAREALTTIEAASRGALDEMRRLLGVLRSEPAEAAREPAPGLDAVDELVARTVAAGVPVSVRVEGERRAWPAGLELAAYRILQEALTNVARHAPGAPASVVLRHRADGLDVEVANGPSGPGGRAQVDGTSDGAGLGLVGMRERAAVYGGDVQAGPTPDGGFRVVASLGAAA